MFVRVLLFMSPVRISASQKGFVQYIVLGLLLVLAAGAIHLAAHRQQELGGGRLDHEFEGKRGHFGNLRLGCVGAAIA